MSLDISSINIHRARKLVFENDSHQSATWFNVKISCENIGHDRDSIALFYDDTFTSADVEKAMIEYLEKSGYEVTKKPAETGEPQMTLRFNDGVEFDTNGELRVERRHDGYYVVGNGMLYAVDTREEGEYDIAAMAKRAIAK